MDMQISIVGKYLHTLIFLRLVSSYQDVFWLSPSLSVNTWHSLHSLTVAVKDEIRV